MTDQTGLDYLPREPFEDPEPAAATPGEPVDGKPRRRGRRPSRLTVIVVVAALILAAGGGIWAASGSSAASYRSATIKMGDVDQTLNSYGTVKPINQAVVAFPVGGTVATVPVTVGEQVKVGQTLATIDKTSLASQLDAAQSTLATAQAKLASDTQAQADGTTVSSNSGGSGSSSSLGPADVGAAVPLTASHSGSRSGGTSGGSGASGGSGSSDATALQTAVTNAQAKLLKDQQAVDTKVSGISQVLTTCASFLSALQNFKPAATPTAGATTSPATPEGSVSDPNDCASKLSAIPGLEAKVTTAEQTVAGDETALTTAIANLAAAASATPTPTPSASPSPSTGGSPLTRRTSTPTPPRSSWPPRRSTRRRSSARWPGP
jgi:multidrug efflux pump subunit AcrA (membrane-fusion protein)